MKIRFLAILSILAIVGMLPIPALAASKPIDYKPVDVGPEIRGWELTTERMDLTGDAAPAGPSASTPISECKTISKIFAILNDYQGVYQFTYFDLVAESDMTQIWVQRNLNWPAGDTRTAPVITCEQAQYLMGEFDNNMYPKETSFFGLPDTHDGSNALLPILAPSFGLSPDYYYDEAGRQIVLVSNVRDDNYYDPTYPNYIAGFYSSTFESYFDRNVMTIDAYDWANRVGPDGTRPYLYEGIFAHEYQHLLHDDYDSDEENFINEGMADFAMVVAGYGDAVTGHLEDTAALPENSLVLWGDQGGLEILADYGQAFLFQYYLMEQFKPEFIQALFHNPDNGITGVNSTLAAFNSRRDFAEVFHDWSIAMLIDSNKPADNRYQFKNLDFKLDIGTPAAPNLEAFSTPGAPPWGTDYLWITGNPKNIRRLTFNGLPYSTFPTAWSSDGSVLWGGVGDLVDNWAIFPAVGGGTLTFDTMYDIEQYWDFAFVQVSTDGGHNWVSLANATTTDLHDPSAHPTVIANLPGLTGTQDTWVNMSFDLSAYAGKDILVAFRYVTDWATSGAGWYIDNVVVNGTPVSDGASVAPFQDITQILPINNDFTVTFVGIKGSGKKVEYKVKVMHLNHVTESGKAELDALLKTSNSVVMLVSFNAQDGVSYYADYTYELVYKQSKPHSHKPVHGHGNGTHFRIDQGHGH